MKYLKFLLAFFACLGVSNSYAASPPTNLSASVSGSSVTFTWSPSPAAGTCEGEPCTFKQYMLQQSGIGDFFFVSNNSNTTSFTLPNVVAGTHSFTLRAYYNVSNPDDFPNYATTPISVTVGSSAPVSVNVDRSLFVHDEATLNAADFSLLSVMNALAAQMSTATPSDAINGTQLFARMWDAQNPTNSSAQTGIANCTGNLNGFPVECRPSPAEGIQAFQAARFISEYRPIGLVNRFDLRDKRTSFKDCGEYRMIFGRPNGGRNFIIFEAAVPNPAPGFSNGCLSIQNLWQRLSTENNATTRATILRNFYFNGIPASNIRAPIDHRNFGVNSGQIRTNQFLSSSTWNLKEYKAVVENGKNTLQVTTVKSNPVSSLFRDSNTDSRSVEFRLNFLSSMTSLYGDPTAFSLTVSNNSHNNGQSHASGSLIDQNNFGSAANFIPNGVFFNQIKNKLSQDGFQLTPQQIVNRATAMTCGGCHQPTAFGLTNANSIGPNLNWPNTLGFVHIRETASGGVFQLSPALINVFLPARKRDMEQYLNNLGQITPIVSTGSKRSG